MFSKDVLALVGLSMAGVIIGGLIGRHLGKTIGTLQKDISLLDRRIIELEIKALGGATTETAEQRGAYADLVVQLLVDKVRQSQKVLSAGGNEKIHVLRKKFVDNEITAGILTTGLLYDVYRNAN